MSLQDESQDEKDDQDREDPELDEAVSRLRYRDLQLIALRADSGIWSRSRQSFVTSKVKRDERSSQFLLRNAHTED